MPRQAFKRRSPVPPKDPRDRALAEQIVQGSVKNWLHLLWLIEHYAARPLEQIEARARLILAAALFQLRFLERVPDHALVTEAVAQTRRLREPGLARAAGFVNAVLRQAIRNPDVAGDLPQPSEAAAYAELVLSHPRPLFEKLEALLGPENALKLCEHNNRTPPTLMRLSRGRRIEDLHREGAGESAGKRPLVLRRLARSRLPGTSRKGSWSSAEHARPTLRAGAMPASPRCRMRPAPPL